MRIVSFNIQNRLVELESHHRARIRRCADLIQSLSPDIACLQEVIPESYEWLQDAFGTAVSLNVPRDDGKLEGEGTSIFLLNDRFTLLDRGHFWLSGTPDEPSRSWRARANRIATYLGLGEADSDRPNLWVYNLHLDHRSRTARRKSLELLASRILAASQPDDQIVVCGDFNMSPKRRTLQRFLSQPPHLLDAAAEHPEQSQTPTFLGWSRLRLAKARIDYCLHSRNLRCSAYHTVFPEREDDEISDHRLIYCDLEPEG